MTISTWPAGWSHGWDGPWYRVRTDAFEVSFALDDEKDIDLICNIDVFVRLRDGSSWSATIFTLAEVGRLMDRWSETGEAQDGRYFWCSDGLIVREPGLRAMTEVIVGLVESEEFSQVFQRTDS
ncbi:hypothetical protein SAMN05216276_10784 [Streptosporangium subroseum]|uniref:Uncharacterized protein n=1 Tax=Streptosporangium subroseum TaxID=106412 RepID=A0A239P0F8_9ACTN|nr:hypothetical protein [Streptosporangium subroseum]SNT60500.1 hypothetical protein SAMN05216276_10784 [Streptosporangium subroseum]